VPTSRLKLAMQVRKLSHDGRDLIDFLFSVVRGEPLPLPGKNGSKSAGRPPRPTPELRVKAAEMLLDRGFGNPKELLELVGEQTEAERQQMRKAMVKHMSEAEREQFSALLHAALERAEAAGDIPPPERAPWERPPRPATLPSPAPLPTGEETTHSPVRDTEG
jgi:hypothetical protein